MSRPFHVFISSTTADLRSYREAAARILREEKGLVAIDEGSFPTMDYQAVRRHLWERLQISDAVIFLIGFHFGGEPSERPANAPRCSFAQLEWDFAELLALPRHVLIASERCPFDNAGATPEPEELQALQTQHRQAIAGPRSEMLWHPFDSMAELERLGRAIDFPGLAPQRPRKPRVLPYPALGHLFVGRAKELARLHEHLTERRTSAALVPAQTIHGLGGVGKTRLAVEYAWAFGDTYRALLFISAETPSALAANLSRLARPEALGVCDPAEDDENRQREAVLRWLETEPDWLLMLDNVDTPEAAAAVQALLPRLVSGHVIITSRLGDWSENVEALALGTLSEEAAVIYLLAKCVARREQPDDTEAALALARALGGLALALEQAGAFINLHGLSLREYHDRWRREDEAVREWFDQDLMRYPRSVMTTWETSFAELGEEARTLLRLLCWLSTEPAPRDLFRTDVAAEIVRARLGAPRVQLLRAVRELTDYSLVELTGGDKVQIHRLVQEVTRVRLPSQETRRVTLVDCLGVVNAFAVGNPYEPGTWPVWEPLRPHLFAVAGWAEGADIHEPTGRLLNQLGILLLRKAAHVEAEQCLRRALRLRTAHFGPRSSEVAVVEENLGTVAERLDHLPEAEQHYRHALAILRELGLGDDEEAASVHNNLAALYVGMNRFDEAATHLHEAMAIDQRRLPANGPQRTSALSNHGVLLWRIGRFAEAEAAYRQAIAIAEAHHGADFPEVSTMLSNLGLVLQEVGRIDEAEQYLRRALVADTATFGPDHPAVGRDANNLALLLRSRGELAEAEKLLRETLGRDRGVLGEQHSEVADDYSNLGLILIDQGRNTEAEECFRRALACDEALYGPSHLRVAISNLNLASALKNRGELGEAFRFTQRALEIQAEKLGPQHPDLALTWNNLAQLLQLHGQLRCARAALRHAMTIDRKAFGRRHPRLGRQLNNLAHIYWQEGRLARAAWLYRSTLIADRAVYGPSHPEIAVDLYNFAELLRTLGCSQEADARHAEAAEIAVRFLPAGSTSVDPRLRSIVETWNTAQKLARLAQPGPSRAK
jgi:tetratricopeptide (TPR) repeat protein